MMKFLCLSTRNCVKSLYYNVSILKLAFTPKECKLLIDRVLLFVSNHISKSVSKFENELSYKNEIQISRIL